MSCKHPLIRAETSERREKKLDGTPMNKIQILKPDDNYESIEDFMKKCHPNWRYTLIPCGKCIGCRLDYSREWANRGFLESKNWEQNYFVTLTYDENHLPKNGTLEPEEFTKFVKRLRTEMARKHGQEEGIRFMGCGEYGEQKQRPHYHIIFFNLKLPIDSFYNARVINKNTYWQNRIIEKCWTYGISNVSDVSWNNIAYTARYITKKIYGKDAHETYDVDVETGEALDREPEFFRVSRNPGIGGYYYDENKDIIWTNDEIIIKNKKGAVSSRPPKYFERLLEKTNPEMLEAIKKQRRKQQAHNEIIKDTLSTNTRLERLAIEERTLTDRTMKLLRQLEVTKGTIGGGGGNC